MKVVLKRDVPGLGRADDIKEVSEGYGRNYLIPRGLAVPATEGIVKAAQDLHKAKEDQITRQRDRAQRIAARLKSEPLHFRVKAGESGRLYGSITSADIAEAIGRSLGSSFDKRQILLEHPIRDLGIHWVDIKIEGGVRTQVRVIVEAED